MRNRYTHPCAVDGCKNQTAEKLYCRAHSDRVKKYGHPMADVPLKPQTPKGGKLPCAVEDCERLAASFGYCNAHHLRRLRYGDVLKDKPIGPGKSPIPDLPVPFGCSWCTGCAQFLSLNEFSKASKRPSGVQRNCKSCQFEKRIFPTYGITFDQYEVMWLAQDGKCGLCGEPETRSHGSGIVHRLCIDHDHACCPGNKSCGKCVRELLCHTCNSGIGMFRESAQRLTAAIEYLARWSTDNNGRNIQVEDIYNTRQ